MSRLSLWFDEVTMRRKLLICFSIPVILILLVSTLVHRNTQSMSENNQWVVHTQLAISRAQELLKLIVDMETGQRGFLITGEEVFLEPYDAANEVWSAKLMTLSQQVSDNPPQVERLIKIHGLYGQWMKYAGEKEIAQRRLVTQGLSPMSSVTSLIQAQTGKQLIDSIRREIKTFIDVEKRLIDIRIARSEASANSTTVVLFVGSFLAVFISVLVSIWSSSRITQRLQNLVDASKSIAEGEFHAGVETLEKPAPSRQRDEVSELSLSFRNMSNDLNDKSLEMIEYTKKLKEETDKAQSATKAKGEFLSTMSHEIRTPLNGVLGLAQIIHNEANDESVKNHSQMILDSGQHLLTILNDILDFTKIEESKIELEQIEFSFCQVLQPVINTIQPLADEKQIEIDVINELQSNLNLIGDSARLRQILLNLLGNAVKFTEEGIVTVRISFDEEISLLTMSVADTGIGIPEHRQANIFNSFEQADNSTTRKFGGTGLGLAIVKKLVDLMGGGITVNSKINEGTLFILHLPMSWALSETIQPPSEESEELNDSIGELNILIAEDNHVNAIVAKSFCEQLGHHVDIAADGLIATQMVQAADYDLIIMDNHMPNMNGVEATAYIRETLKLDTVIFAYTADVFREAHDNLINAGVDHVLTKPMQNDSFEDALERFSSKLIKSHQLSNSNVADFQLHREPLERLKLTEEELSHSAIFNTLKHNIESRNSLIKVMNSEFSEAVDTILSSYSNEDSEPLHRALHSLKGMSKSLDLPILASLALALEQEVREDKLPSSQSMQKLINRLQVNMHQGERLLESAERQAEVLSYRSE